MRDFVHELQLVHPVGVRYRPAPTDALAEEGRRLAERDLAAGLGPMTWPAGELETWLKHPTRYWRMMRTYTLVLHPNGLATPPAWPDELAGIAGGTLRPALQYPSVWPRQGWRGAAITALSELLDAHAAAARHRRARALHLDPATAPRAAHDRFAPVWLGITTAYSLWRFFHGPPRTSMPWPVYLASRIVGALRERRSWRRAVAA